jgi:2-keto-4-pentenoate hydratase
VLPGSFTAAIDVKAGDIVTAIFAGRGNVTAHFRPITAQGETTGAS